MNALDMLWTQNLWNRTLIIVHKSCVYHELTNIDIESRGGIRVNDFLQILSDNNDVQSNIFAIADISKTSLSEEKVIISLV